MIYRRLITTVIMSLLLVLSAAVAASAIIPPQDCGAIRVSGKRYLVKADQMRCKTAKSLAREFLTRRARNRTWCVDRGRSPDCRFHSGYGCNTYSKSTALAFRCDRGMRVVFAIKR